jgi:hypothetical protein
MSTSGNYCVALSGLGQQRSSQADVDSDASTRLNSSRLGLAQESIDWRRTSARLI